MTSPAGPFAPGDEELAHDDQLARWDAAHRGARMRGWDFSSLDGVLVANDPPWDFEADCLDHLRSAQRALDLGTGGGERLLRLLDALGTEMGTDPARAGRAEQAGQAGPAKPAAQGRVIEATEGWEPNVPVAREALAPAGITVHRCDPEQGDPLPASDSSLDLVMSRHEVVPFAEVARVLAPGGVLLTQQVHGLDAPELRAWFGGEHAFPEVTLENYRAGLEEAGLAVDTAEEWSGPMRFSHVEALVTYLGFVPWEVPEFRVADHAEKLRQLEAHPPIVLTQRRFRLAAHRP